MALISEAEHRILTFLCFREIMTDDERVEFLNNHISIIVGHNDQPREWKRFKIANWKRYHRGSGEKFFTPDQRSAESLIYNQSMNVLDASDQRTIKSFIQKHNWSLPTIVNNIWTNAHNGLLNPYTSDDIEQAVYAIVRKEVSERRDIHDARTWPRTWMVKLAQIWEDLGGVLEDPFPEGMLPTVRDWLRSVHPEHNFGNDEFEEIDMIGAKVLAVKWGFIRGLAVDNYLQGIGDETLDFNVPALSPS